MLSRGRLTVCMCLVCPGVGLTDTVFTPLMTLMSDDLPTLGFPTSPMHSVRSVDGPCTLPGSAAALLRGEAATAGPRCKSSPSIAPAACGAGAAAGLVPGVEAGLRAKGDGLRDVRGRVPFPASSWHALSKSSIACPMRTIRSARSFAARIASASSRRALCRPLKLSMRDSSSSSVSLSVTSVDDSPSSSSSAASCRKSCCLRRVLLTLRRFCANWASSLSPMSATKRSGVQHIPTTFTWSAARATPHRFSRNSTIHASKYACHCARTDGGSRSLLLRTTTALRFWSTTTYRSSVSGTCTAL
mmetsp:Transcript_13674/g.42524  ORF Transcript_13674/g.42524 Transcript_13674/m.42524 type:complete len:302 (-) Transcript_13674:760-1665(-)